MLQIVARFNANYDRMNLNCNRNSTNSNASLGMALLTKTFIMKTYKNIYFQIYNINNLFLAYKKARKGKTKKPYVIKFCKNLGKNLKKLQFELMSLTYKPKPLKTFILRDPKTSKISKSDFRDRIVHHVLFMILVQIKKEGYLLT